MKQLRTSELADIEKQDSEKSTFLVQYSLNGTQSQYLNNLFLQL